MGFNMYKQIDNIKNELEADGYKKDIPKDVFCKKMMVLYGMKKKTSINWFENFLTVDFISISNDGKICFKDD